jgi:hypothetical protein
VEVVADLHLRPYYGDEDDTDGLYHSEAKAGTTGLRCFKQPFRVGNGYGLGLCDRGRYC